MTVSVSRRRVLKMISALETELQQSDNERKRGGGGVKVDKEEDLQICDIL